MAKPEPRPPTPYERFVAATRAIVAVPKKEVDVEIRQLRLKRRRAKKRLR